ncbi:hypothetical protein BGZ76_002812 [Entomortierella beljakovae]|nr:hypothetical protein BGZ76_002812 [Entomortierella beljakovae]
MTRSIRKCSHGPEPFPTIQHNVVSSIEGLSQYSPWTQDFEIDLDNLCLPITVSIGLQCNDMSKTSREKLGAYFPVESFDLDGIHFSEPVRDRSKQNPTYYAHAIGTSLELQKNNDDKPENPAKYSILSTDINDGHCKDCISAVLKPLTFRFNTSEVNITQCLPVLFGDGISNNQLEAVVHSSSRASFSIPDECLPLPRHWKKASNVQQNDTSLVWVILDVKEGSGSTAQATLDIKGADRTRVLSVYYALERRVDEFFG